MKLPWREVGIPGAPEGELVSTSLTLTETKALQILAADRRVLEIGSAHGYSAISMALVGARVFAVDPHGGEVASSLEEMRANIERFNVQGRVVMALGRSQLVLPMLAVVGAKFDLVFVDGDHSESAVKTDVALASTLLEDGGVVACHDYSEESCPGVQAALERWDSIPHQVIDTLWVARL